MSLHDGPFAFLYRATCGLDSVELFLNILLSNDPAKLVDHVTSTGHNFKWDRFDILAKGRSDTHRKIKETLLIRELKPTLNDNVSSEKLYLY